MKRILCAFLLLASFSYLSKLNAQNCGASSPVVSNISTQNINGSCTVTFDLQFSLDHNNGNKYSAVYIYSGTLPANFYANNGKTVPSNTDINAVANILGVIEFNTSISTTKTLATYTGGGSSANPTVFKPSLDFVVTPVTGTVD
ncbi:MAG: hypothetical protein M3Y85_13030, partial [Bacteroidota bacterium]|nr:hypothetical protein [Bacteroidota bacterium]